MDSLLAELHTVRDWLRWGVSRFNEARLAFGHGTDNAYDEAAYLILHALHLPHDRLEPFLDARLAHSERLAVLNLLQLRIARRVPAAYLTQEAWLGECRYDLIICNPPYVTAAAMAALPPEYRREPALALGAGADGLDVVRRILAAAGAHLKPGGLLAIEVGHNRDIVDAAFPQLPLTWIDTPSSEDKIFLVRGDDLRRSSRR